ncbi:unnamed protein product [Leptosia nina]|uniref:BED-type domain-containing protein n=1 Tax=Leptosia nina TaxID=320188 RepID=A0AAV1JHL7_9NEOP
MVPTKKSIVWKYFEKIDEKSARCKLCQKIVKTAGNTSNTMAHIKNVHKAVYLEVFKSNNSAAGIKHSNSGSSDSFSTTSKQDTITISESYLNEHQLSPSTSTSSSMDCSEILTHNTQTDQKMDYDRVLSLKRQRSIESSFGEIHAYTSTGDKTKRINNAIMFMICRDNQPFSLVENEGFKNLLKVTVPHYKIPSRTSVTRWIDEKYDALSTVMKNKLCCVENLTLTSDIWSDLQMRSYLGVTAHFGIGIEFHVVTLGVYHLDERHTSEYIAQTLTKTCEEWGFNTDKVTAVVTDNAANMVKAVEIAFGKKKHIPCFAHTLNLVAQHVLAIPELQEILTKAKSVVTFFKQSCVASDELRKSIQADTKLIQDVPTRWNSTYYMIARFLDLRNAVSEILIRHKTAPPMLTGMELTILTSLLNVLQPLEAATKEISGDKYCSSSKIIPLVHCMISKLKNLVIEESLIKDVQKRTLTEINKRMGAIEQVSALAIATILDPRFKKLHFEDAMACANAVIKIKEMIKKNQQDESTVESDSDNSDKISLSSDLWSDHHKLVQRNWKTNNTNESLSDELSLYLRTPVSRFNENPLKVWADYKIQFPTLYNVAFKYLTMVASSVPSERLFSKAAQVLTQQRSRLQAKRVNKILFLQSLEKKYWDL